MDHSEYSVEIARKMVGRNLTRRENYQVRSAANKIEKAGGILTSRQAIGVLLQIVETLPMDEQGIFELDRLQKEAEDNKKRVCVKCKKGLTIHDVVYNGSETCSACEGK